jgi:hypothetical protein
MERELLDHFRGFPRQVPFPFADYFPPDFTPAFTLSEWLTGRPALATAKRFRSQPRNLPPDILQSLAGTDEADD